MVQDVKSSTTLETKALEHMMEHLTETITTINSTLATTSSLTTHHVAAPSAATQRPPSTSLTTTLPQPPEHPPAIPQVSTITAALSQRERANPTAAHPHALKDWATINQEWTQGPHAGVWLQCRRISEGFDYANRDLNEFYNVFGSNIRHMLKAICSTLNNIQNR
jgi:hypothetical protein